jgi:hypothetical protein
MLMFPPNTKVAPCKESVNLQTNTKVAPCKESVNLQIIALREPFYVSGWIWASALQTEIQEGSREEHMSRSP